MDVNQTTSTGHGAAFRKKRRAKNPVAADCSSIGGSHAVAPDAALLDLKSVWQCKDVAAFFEHADAICKDFTSTRDVRLVHMPQKYRQLPIHTDVVPATLKKPNTATRPVESYIELTEKYLTIPRRPAWNYDSKKEEVELREKDSFNKWKRDLMSVEEKLKVLLAPFERNLEVWRQLWRVVERSDVIFQIVDARNPLQFRSVDLERFTSEHTSRIDASPKQCILLLNKADLLTDHQRQAWSVYLREQGIPFVFFSALRSWESHTRTSEDEHLPCPLMEIIKSAKNAPSPYHEQRKQRRLRGCVQDQIAKRYPAWVYERAAALGKKPLDIIREDPTGALCGTDPRSVGNEHKAHAAVSSVTDSLNELETIRSQRIARSPFASNFVQDGVVQFHLLSSPHVLDASMLLDLMVAIQQAYAERWSTAPKTVSKDSSHAVGGKTAAVHQKAKQNEQAIMVGFVGYPNVGKSCTINALLGIKKVTVSSTPGKTKHMQTLPIPHERRVLLCDCPGLVFPNLCLTAEQMVCDGILPISHMKDFILPAQLVCSRIPRRVLEAAYNVSLDPDDDVDRCFTLADALLSAIARRRGFMGDHDQPDRGRSARVLLHDFVSGKLIYVHPPLGSDAFNPSEAPNATTGTKFEDDEDWEDAPSEEEDTCPLEPAKKDTSSKLAATVQLDQEENEDMTVRFYAPPVLTLCKSQDEVTTLLAQRRREEEFNRNVNKAIIEAREADLERRRHYTGCKKTILDSGNTDKIDELWTQLDDGEIALAVHEDDGIVCFEAPVEGNEAEGEMDVSAPKNKRQQRREEKRKFLNGPRLKHVDDY